MDLKDQQIVEAINNGDRKTFKVVFDHYFQSLFLSSMKLVREQDIAEEIVHDVFVSMWNREDPIVLHTSFEGYIFRSVRNRSLNHLKKKYVSTETGLDDQVFHLSNNDRSNEPVELTELNTLIQEGLDQLPDTTKAVFSMSRFGDQSYKEIAEELGCTIKNVEYHMGRSLKFMRSHLDKYGYLYFLGQMDIIVYYVTY